MAGAVVAAAGGTASLTLPDLMYEEHMSNIQKHSIVIDTERASVTADKKHVQAIQKAEWDCIEENNANTTNRGSGHGPQG